MRKYILTIAYDGSKYKGWQRLSHTDKTIQQKIEDLLSKIIGEPIQITGSGRTDVGVHAYEQIAHFETNNQLELESFLAACNHMLPMDIVFKKIEEAASDFHARFSAKSKRYVYKIWNSSIPSPFQRHFSYHVSELLDLKAMEKAASYLIGEHDFQSFTANKSKKKSMVRSIYAIDIRRDGEEIELHFHGEGFLHKMVRIITGTLIEVGLGEKEPEDIPYILNKKDRKYGGKTAPGHGLFLYKVEY